MRRGRRRYYDLFSGFYDGFIALHSRDRQGLARKFLVQQIPLEGADWRLDLCTGTGSVLPYLQARAGSQGRVVGVDFSHGMLKQAQKKCRGLSNVVLVEAEAGCLPFASASFAAVTCSHAFYELKGPEQGRALEEIVRVLKPGGSFFMMEHDVPRNRLVRGLFYLRLTIAGTRPALAFLRHEKEVLQRYFGGVDKIAAPAGRSKVLVCRTQSPAVGGQTISQ